MNVFIVEDSVIMRNILQSMLADISNATPVGHAVDELSAINGIDILMPDVVILDLNLEYGSGIGVLEHVKTFHSETKVMVLTNHNDEIYFNRCRAGGADYFFDKSFEFNRVRAVLGQWAKIKRPDRKLNA